MPNWRAEAAIHRNAGRWDQAIQCYQTILAQTPNDVDVLHDLGLIFIMQGQLDDAIRLLTHATQSAPHFAPLFKRLGEAHMQCGESAPAVAAFGRAIALDPKDDDCLVKHGIASASLGQAAQALASYDAAIAINPQSIAAYYNRSGLKKYQTDDPELAVLETLLPDLSPSDQVLAHFILGKGWMDAGDSEKAFDHFHQGNRLHRGTLSYDVDQAIAQMQDVIQTFTPDLLHRLSGGGDPSDIPIFVLGMPRSGSTLIEQILASHPQVTGAGEIAAFRQVVGRIKGADGQSLRYPDLLNMMPPDACRVLGDLYLKLVARHVQGKARLVDKYLDNFLYAGLIHLVLPNARIIHCRRYPVDTCLSCYTLLFGASQDFTYDLDELGRYWRAYDALMHHWKTLLPADRFIEVEYEHLVSDFEPQVRQLVASLGLPWDDACLAFHKTERTVLSASNAQVRQPIHGGSVGRWKRHAAYIKPLLDALGINQI